MKHKLLHPKPKWESWILTEDRSMLPDSFMMSLKEKKNTFFKIKNDEYNDVSQVRIRGFSNYIENKT